MGCSFWDSASLEEGKNWQGKRGKRDGKKKEIDERSNGKRKVKNWKKKGGSEKIPGKTKRKKNFKQKAEILSNLKDLKIKESHKNLEKADFIRKVL